MSGAARVPTHSVRLAVMRYAAPGTTLYEFEPLDGAPLPAFSAGAHVDLHLPNGMVRQYSLANDPVERSRYMLGIKKEPAGRGGSAYIHAHLQPGMVLEIGAPRNNFPLVETAGHSLFIAGGIGITPIRSMIHRAESLGLSWELHYAVRAREEAVFGCELANDMRMHLHADDEHGGCPIDLVALAKRADPSAHVYCCGPAPMLEAFEQAFAHLPAPQRHVEHFAAPAAVARPGDSFTVVLARSGRTFEVPADRSILQVLREAGIAVEASCEQGICGACETRVLGGQPEHRDILLSTDERQAGHSMMICCSRSVTPELMLDL